MKLSTVLPAAFAALTLAAVAGSTAEAAPADREYTTRAVRSPNSKDVFVRFLKVPKMQASVEKGDCPMDPALCAQPKANQPEAQG